MFYLKPPRHISTLPKTEVAALRRDVCFAPVSGHRQPHLLGPKSATTRHGAYHFRFARGLATSRAQSTKSLATGLSARFFRVTIPFGLRALGSSTGRTLISERLGEKSKCGSRENGDKTAGRQQTNAHMRAIRNHAHPGIIEPAGAKSVHYDRSNHAVRWWQHPQFVHQFGNFDPAPPRPLILRTRRNDIGIVKKKFEVVSRVCDRARASYDQEIDITLGEFPVQCLRVSGHEMEYDARIAPREPVDESGNEARGQKGGGSNPQFPGRRVGEKRDVLHALAQVIAIQQGAVVH